MRTGVVQLVDTLARAAGEPSDALLDPYAMVLHENAGYLVDDAKRDDLYARIVALAPDADVLMRTRVDDLLAIARDGGMRPAERVERWLTIAWLTADEAKGDLTATLRALDLRLARRFLRRYPAIGEPGADRILLFGGIAAVPSVESNGVRVLERYGLVAPGRPYASQYRDATKHLAGAFGTDAAALRRAYTVLRSHGKTTCRRTRPECERCAVRDLCPTGRRRVGTPPPRAVV